MFYVYTLFAQWELAFDLVKILMWQEDTDFPKRE